MTLAEQYGNPIFLFMFIEIPATYYFILLYKFLYIIAIHIWFFPFQDC